MKQVIEIDPPMTRNLFFSKDIDSESVEEVIKKIIEINEYDEKLKIIYKALQNIDYNPMPIKIFIDSFGGSVYNCFGLLSIIECSKTPIYTIVTGVAMSAAFLILICGHKRFCYELSTMLYHQISYDISDGTIKDIRDSFAETERMQNMVENITMKKTKISKNKIEEIYNKKEDWYITPSEAKKLGIIDKILKKDDELK
jgi:ATP-dependent Clp protease protease subunit